MKRNVLLITSDQQRWDTIGILNDKIKTPNLDKLARDGILFNRGYTNNPVCTPSRISMLTGHYPSKHGCYTIGTSLDEDYPTVPEIVSKNGYKTALIGKAHFQPCLHEGSFESEPNIHNDELFKRWNGPYYGFEHAELIIGHGDEPHSAGMHYGLWLEEQGINRSDYFGKNKYYEYGKWDLPDELSSSNWTAIRTIEAIKSARNEDKPFYIWSSFQNPHNPCVVPEPWYSMYDDVDVPIYDYVEGEFDNKPPLYENIKNWDLTVAGEDHLKYGVDVYEGEKNWHCVSGLDSKMGTKNAKKDIMKLYYAMVSQMDHYIGKIIDYLKENGLYENTTIIFTSDHGDYMGNHGLWWKGLPAFEDAQRVPFIVYDPKCKTKGLVSESLQSVIDIPTTILHLTGCDVPWGQQGVNQANGWLNGNEKLRDHVRIEFRPTEGEFMQKTLVTDSYKIVCYANREYGELYDLNNDINQYNNLWDNQEYVDVKLKLLMKVISSDMDKDGTLRTRFAPA